MKPQWGWRQLTFPKAAHYLGGEEWPEVTARLVQPGSLEARTLEVVHRSGRLSLVDWARDVTPEVSTLPAPGETAGHQMVRLHSKGETFYALGDMFHHPVEFEEPEWMVNWAAAASNVRSRAALVSAALQENALLMASHIRGMGRLAVEGGRIRWTMVR